MTDQVAQIPGWNALLMGDSGAGKTTTLRTLVEECGLELFTIFTEPGMDLLADLPPEKCRWAYIPPGTGDFTTMLDQVTKAQKMSWDLMSKMTSDPNKSKYMGLVKLLTTLANFKDDRTGEEFGPVDSWDTNRVLAIDSLSGINTMAMQFATGQSIARSQPQWGAAMSTELNLINKLCYDTKCHFVLTAPLDKQIDQIHGGQIIQANALGQKNAPEIPKNFTDVILQVNDAGKFRWSTMQSNVAVKGRNLPLSDKLAPTFKDLHGNWCKRAYGLGTGA